MPNNSFRIEKDFLGSLEVPKEAYYGVQTMRAVENFPITGYRIYSELIHSLALVKKAAAQANMDIGQLEPAIGKAIIQAADEIMGGHYHDQFITDPIQGGAGTSINMNANEVIANRALEILGKDKGDYATVSPNNHVNMSQSTNDAFPTANHIAILNLLDRLLKTTRALADTFKKKAQEFDGIIKMGRTHLQDAVPIRLGQEFEAYRRVLERDIRRMDQTRQALFEINMGATAVGTGLNAEPKYIERVVKLLAEFSGYPMFSAGQLVDATQNCDAYTETSAALKLCMINMSKIANDLRLMSSGPRAGIKEITLPARQPGSSIMPGKVNPVMAELINQVAFQVIGNDTTISMAAEAGQFELNVMEPVLVFNLMQSISIMNNAFQSFQKYCLEGITANVEQCQSYVNQSVGIITALNPHLGYETVSKIAAEAIATGRSVRELCLEYKVLTPKELDEILDPHEMTSPGIAGAKFLHQSTSPGK